MFSQKGILSDFCCAANQNNPHILKYVSYDRLRLLQPCGKCFSWAPPILCRNFYPLAPPPLRNFHSPSVGGGERRKFSGMCGSRKYPYPPHGGSRNFLGVGGSKRDKFLKGRGVHKEFFFPEGLKCDRMNTYVFFQLIRGSQEKPKVLSVEIDVGFLVIYFLLLSRRQMTRTAPRHTSEHVRRRVKQNG